MRTMNGRLAAVLALSLAAACGGGGGTPDPNNRTATVDSTGTTMDESPGPGEAQGTNVTPIARPEQTMAAGTLSPVNNSGVTGSVNLRGIGEQTEVSLQVTTAPAGTQQLNAAVVQGTCQQPGTEVAPVGPLTVGAGNVAALTDTLNLPPGTVLNG
ncbi:MAG: hypothetical protein KY444_06140, partial [Gemmatimonadetes bacterium]|nr:hypothetical protein [Gemmatimonadota bacterium]